MHEYMGDVTFKSRITHIITLSHARLVAEVDRLSGDQSDYSDENFAYGSTPASSFIKVTSTQAVILSIYIGSANIDPHCCPNEAYDYASSMYRIDCTTAKHCATLHANIAAVMPAI